MEAPGAQRAGREELGVARELAAGGTAVHTYALLHGIRGRGVRSGLRFSLRFH